MKQVYVFGSWVEAVVYPLLLTLLLWLVYWAELVSGLPLTDYGIEPGNYSTWIGIFAMPLLHSKTDWTHLVNNSVPLVVLLGALIYYYRQIALKVFVLSWIGTGVGLLFIAPASTGIHIGMSGVVYALFGFMFLSGMFRRYLPLQGISLFVIFLYGGMIWGIFPSEERISWEGHLTGLFVGVVLAVIYRKQGPQAPKYQYEIEKELGIEPPDLEGIYNARLAEYEAMKRQQEEMEKNDYHIIYHYIPANKMVKEEKPLDDTSSE